MWREDEVHDGPYEYIIYSKRMRGFQRTVNVCSEIIKTTAWKCQRDGERKLFLDSFHCGLSRAAAPCNHVSGHADTRRCFAPDNGRWSRSRPFLNGRHHLLELLARWNILQTDRRHGLHKWLKAKAKKLANGDVLNISVCSNFQCCRSRVHDELAPRIKTSSKKKKNRKCKCANLYKINRISVR